MAAGSIVVDLIANTGGFSSDIDRSTKAAEKRLKDFQKTADAIGVAVGAAFVAAGTAAVYFGKQVIDGLDALNDVADVTGSTIENISALEDVALRTGASLENVSASMLRFNNVLKEADGKNGASLALQAIGVSVEELKKLDPAEALRQTAVALSGFADDANKARIVQELFGKSVKEIGPYLKDLAESGQLNAKVTADQAAEAERFNKSLFELQTNVNQLARDFSGPLLKSINDTIKAFKEGKAAGEGFFETAARRYANNIRDVYGIERETVGSSTGRFTPGVMGPPSSLANPQSLPDIQKLQAAAKAEDDARKEADKAAKARQAAAKSANEQAERYIDQLNQQILKLEEVTAVEKVLDDIANGRFNAQTDAQKRAALAAAENIDMLKEQAEAEKSAEDSAKRLAQAQKQVADEVKSLYESVRSPIQVFNDQMARLDELLDAGRIGIDLYSQAMANYKDQLADATKKTDDSLDRMSKFAERAQENIQDALGDTLEQALSGNFDNIGKMWASLLAKMAAQALSAQLLDQLFPKTGGSSGGGQKFDWVGAIAKLFTSTPMATGTNYVPYDGFQATLHEGEAVIPKKFNPAAGGSGVGGMNIDFGTTYVGSNVSLPEVDNLIKRRNAEMLAKIERTNKQRTMM